MVKTQCGFIAIIGQPNVGKSTLLNYLLGKKISITSRKPQTTRHRILGVKTKDNLQYVYVDTPGMHRHTTQALNRYMNRVARHVLDDVDIDVIVLLVDARHFDSNDEWVLGHLTQSTKPIILAINKIDLVKNREELLPYIERVSKQHQFLSIVPISAKNGIHMTELESRIATCLPEQVHLFPEEQITDRSDSFIAAETVREKLMRILGEELPYAITVTLDAFEQQPGNNLIKISAIIWVEKESQKGIVIGKSGERLKSIGQKARVDMERFFSKKIFLQVWVKVKKDWSSNESMLHQLGYNE